MIEVARHGRIAVATLAHGKANTLDLELCHEIVRLFDALEADAVVLTGRGTIFSAGVDLVRAVAGGAPYLREFLPVLSQAFATVFFCPKPVVAALNGHAVAGGCVLACAADRRLMAREPGRIGVTELLVGVPFPTMPLEIMRAAAAPQHLDEMLLSGATYPPEAARERGLVHEVVEADALLERAIATAESLSSLPPAAYAVTKQQRRAAARTRWEERGAADAAIEDIWVSPDTLARMRDYVARTLKK